ncbi:nucleotide exchange factor GrpE [Phytohalomonas tamaricis]|uniref:nucleotide exchange factor GrpE n=1 Tax=Phytohalomonas tamaricis TaxID=2081032 RepID=UPI000D0AF213|nr:nucleotide exchange factor GrpE [Phytohalomonas tamaricis]
MAKNPQNPNPADEELDRATRDAEPQPLDIDNENNPIDDVSVTPDESTIAAFGEASEEELSIDAATTADAEINADTDVLAARIEELEQALVTTRDQSLRAAAEAQNARRRADQDIEKARKFALEKFVKELLPVVDSLEKALESMGDDADQVHREGVSMTLKLQLDVLNKFGVVQVDPQGEPFDPQYHEAMSMVPSPSLDPNTVMDVMQKGYTLNGRLVRPAMVVVSKAAQ